MTESAQATALLAALPARMADFCRAYRGKGSGLHAARLAGYEGNDRTVTVRAGKLLADARVRAALRALGHALPPDGAEVPPDAGAPLRASSRDDGAEGDRAVTPPDDDEVTEADGELSLAALRQIASDEQALPSARARAAEVLLRRADAIAARGAIGDPHAELRAKMADVLRARRARERETGRCASCGAPLERGPR